MRHLCKPGLRSHRQRWPCEVQKLWGQRKQSQIRFGAALRDPLFTVGATNQSDGFFANMICPIGQCEWRSRSAWSGRRLAEPSGAEDLGCLIIIGRHTTRCSSVFLLASQGFAFGSISHLDCALVYITLCLSHVRWRSCEKACWQQVSPCSVLPHHDHRFGCLLRQLDQGTANAAYK